MRSRSGIACAVVVLAVLALPACSSSQHAMPSEAGSVAASASSANLNMSDLMFVQMMIPHHEQAVELAALAFDRSTNPQVLDLANRISSAQGPEIEQMQAMLSRWGVDATMDHSGHDMPGIVDDATMEEIRASKGAAFDKLFLTSMIAHHQGAIDMARDPLENGSDPELRTLLEAIVAAQSAEIEEMNAMLGTMGASN